jgi:hypothetical protein
MIKDLGVVAVPAAVIEAAASIKLQNYKTNTPKRFQVQPLHERGAWELMQQLAVLAQVPQERLDFVYFSVCKGAEPHVDALDWTVFEPRTLVVPIILPSGTSTITANGDTIVAKLGHVYEFNHELLHSMELEDTESGCVVVMVAVKREQHERVS